MKTSSLILSALLLAACLTACGNKQKHEQQKEQLRQEVRSQFYERKLAEAEAQLAQTDSLLQQALADPDTLNVEKRVRLDSLKHAADVQGAQIRYLHKKKGS